MALGILGSPSEANGNRFRAGGKPGARYRTIRGTEKEKQELIAIR